MATWLKVHNFVVTSCAVAFILSTASHYLWQDQLPLWFILAISAFIAAAIRKGEA